MPTQSVDLPESDSLKWKKGWPGALDRLMPLVLPTLRHIAATRFSHSRSGVPDKIETLGELYIRLAGNDAVEIRNRGEFFYSVSVLMRRFLVDSTERSATSAGPKDSRPRPRPEEWGGAWAIQPGDLALMDRSLDKLEELDFRHGVIVSLKIFLGMNDHDISELLGLSEQKVRRQWILARTWLRREMKRRQ